VPNWAKVVTLIIGLGGYSATVIATLVQGKIPDIGTLGIPAALILALAPPVRIGRRRATSAVSGRRGATAAEDEQAADEGDSA
jgi:hypothetical protein